MTKQLEQQRITLQSAVAETGLSESTIRRAIRDTADPLVCIRVGTGDPKHARILIRRADLESWLQRRNAALTVPVRAIVAEVVAKVREDAA